MITSAAEFVRLRTSTDPAEYHRAAWEPAPMEVWLEVIENHPSMRSWVAHNKAVPVEVLKALVHDPDSRVRSTVASKRKLPPELFRTLANDAESSVRHTVVCNAKVPLEVLERLGRDQERFVREAALERLRSRAEEMGEEPRHPERSAPDIP